MNVGVHALNEQKNSVAKIFARVANGERDGGFV
jgi:hypothetical protein